MEILLIILLIAASPLLFVFIFSEVMAAKEGSKVQNAPRKFSKMLVWLMFGLISFFLLYFVITDGPGYHLRQAFKFISAGLEFLK